MTFRRTAQGLRFSIGPYILHAYRITTPQCPPAASASPIPAANTCTESPCTPGSALLSGATEATTPFHNVPAGTNSTQNRNPSP